MKDTCHGYLFCNRGYEMNEIVDIQKLSYEDMIKAIVFRFTHLYNFHKYGKEYL